MAKGKKGDGGTIVIKRIEEAGHGHHGGAWKVAYADFVTAMMAFFLLMWLLNATTEQQRRGLADYFNPSNPMSTSSSGVGLPFGGSTAHSQGQMASDTGSIRLERGLRPTNPDQDDDEFEEQSPATQRRQGPAGEVEDPQQTVVRTADGPPAGEHRRAGHAEPRDSDAARMTDLVLRAELARREQVAMEETASALREAIRQDPGTADLARQVQVEVTPEGLRIQLIDADGRPMFALGSAEPNERTRALIRVVAQAAQRLPNPIQVTGHTDATPFRGVGARGNWELSAERANAARRLLLEAGVTDARIRGVAGSADRDLHIPDQPTAAGNRRVAITLLRQQGPAR
jgi:chemotaxis protein MotB